MTELHEADAASILAIKTDAFEGPLELLLELIEKRKLLINDISLAAVTDDFMVHVAEMERSPLHETSQFVHLASTLLLIKSKSLLPVLDLTPEEEEGIEELQDRLRLYQIYRDAGRTIAAAFGNNTLYSRQFVQDTEPVFLPDRWTTKDALAETIGGVLANLPKKVERPKVQVRKTVTLEQMIDRLRERVEQKLKFGFREFTGNAAARGDVIVGFLAVLEMVKQGLVMVRQTGRYDDIEIEREAGGTPRYM